MGVSTRSAVLASCATMASTATRRATRKATTNAMISSNSMNTKSSAKMMITTPASSSPLMTISSGRRASAFTKRSSSSSSSSVRVNAMFGGDESNKSDSGDEFKKIVNDVVYVDPVVGAKRFSNYFWASVVTAGASGFLITGASAYFKHNLVFFLDASDIQFFPQGLVMSFYGIAGLLLATYLWLTINWNVGAGYNEFNKEEGIFRVFRYGFPGKNRLVNLLTDLKDVTAVRVEISDGINPRRVVYVKCKGKGDIPLTRIGQPLTLAEVERQAAELAKFLQVPIEGL